MGGLRLGGWLGGWFVRLYGDFTSAAARPVLSPDSSASMNRDEGASLTWLFDNTGVREICRL